MTQQLSHRCCFPYKAQKVVLEDKAGAKVNIQEDRNEKLLKLENANKAMQKITKGDITEIKNLNNPPQLVKTVMEAV